MTVTDQDFLTSGFSISLIACLFNLLWSLNKGELFYFIYIKMNKIYFINLSKIFINYVTS